MENEKIDKSHKDYVGSYEQWIDQMRANTISLEIENKRNEALRLQARKLTRTNLVRTNNI